MNTARAVIEAETKEGPPLSKKEIKTVEQLVAKARQNQFHLPSYDALYLADLVGRAQAHGQHQPHWPTRRDPSTRFAARPPNYEI